MFYFLRKTILHASPTHQLQCLQKYIPIISIKYISSNANQRSFTVSYLINSCGLSPESALSASKRVNFETPDKPDLVLHLLENHGFSKTQIINLIKKSPRVLVSSPEKIILPKLVFFGSKGIPNDDVAKMLSLYPALLHRSLEDYIIPSFNSLSNLLLSSEKAITLIKGYPRILRHNSEHYVVRIKILRDRGVPESNIVKFVSFSSHLSMVCRENFEESVAFVKEMGISPLRSQFVIAVVAKSGMSKSFWEKKLDVYKQWGWSEEEFLAAFTKYPWCMMTNIDKIMAVMNLLVNEMGWESSYIAKHPILTTLSMEKRLIPRAAVIQFLLSKGLVKKKVTYLVFLYPEKTFVQRFINSYDEAPELLKLYEEKFVLSKKTI